MIACQIGDRKEKTYHPIPIQIPNRPRRKADVLVLYKTHRPVDLLPETHPFEPGALLKQGAEGIFEVARRMRGRGDGGQVADIERVDL